MLGIYSSSLANKDFPSACWLQQCSSLQGHKDESYNFIGCYLCLISEGYTEMYKTVGPENLCCSSRRKQLMFIAGMSSDNTHIPKTRVTALNSLYQVASHGNR